MLKIDELTHGHVERLGDADKNIDADVSRSHLDLPEIGAARPCHEGELPLRDAALGASGLDVGAEGSLFAHVVHAASIRAVRWGSALCREHVVFQY